MTQHFVVTDPREFDGDPYEVAERACRQAEAVATLLEQCIEGANLMARNAQMERNLYDSDDAKAAEWEGSVQGQRFEALLEKAGIVKVSLKVLARAVAFNPRKT